jgi:hypothetical protein
MLGGAVGEDKEKVELRVLQPSRVINAPEDGWDTFFGSCSWYCGAPQIRFVASSFLSEASGLQHPALQAHDGKMDRVWCEGAEGQGLGESLTFTFVTTEEDTTDLGVTSCAIGIGHQASKRLFRRNSRPKILEMSMDGRPVAKLKLRDVMGLQHFDFPKLRLERPSKHTISFKIIDVYPGAAYQDTCIAEVYFQGTGRMH